MVTLTLKIYNLPWRIDASATLADAFLRQAGTHEISMASRQYAKWFMYFYRLLPSGSTFRQPDR